MIINVFGCASKHFFVVTCLFYLRVCIMSSSTQQQQQWQKMSKRECGGKLE